MARPRSAVDPGPPVRRPVRRTPIQLIIAPEPDNPDRPCEPREIIEELIESNSFKITVDVIYEETPEGEPEGNCHNAAMSIMGDLMVVGRSKGLVWWKGRRKSGMQDGGDFVHSWLEREPDSLLLTTACFEPLLSKLWTPFYLYLGNGMRC